MGISLKDITERSIDKISVQITYEDSNTGERYLFESQHTNKYHRYTVCVPYKDKPVSAISFGESQPSGGLDFNLDDMLDNLDQFEISLDLDDIGDTEVTDDDLWNRSNESRPGEFKMDSEIYDPNDVLDGALESEQEKVHVEYINDESIKMLHYGKPYEMDYFVKDQGVLAYDEIIFAVQTEQRKELNEALNKSKLTGRQLELYDANGKLLSGQDAEATAKNIKKIKKLVKHTVGDDKAIEDFTIMINPLTMFMASKGVKSLGTTSKIEGRQFLIYSSYTNEKGATYQEIRDSYGNLYKEIYHLDNITITQKHLNKESVYGYESLFTDKKFNVDYSVYELVSSNTGKLKTFKDKKTSRAIYLPNVQFFKDRLNMPYLENANYEIIDTLNALIDIVDMLLSKYPNKDRVIGYDAETMGLLFHRWVKNPHQLVTHSLSWEDDHSIIIPVRMRYEQNINPREAAEVLKPVLEQFPILAHNGAADVRFNLYEGIDINLTEDTMHLIKHILPFVNHKEVVGFGRAIDDLLYQMYGVEMIDLHKWVFAPSGAQFDFSLLNRDYMKIYGCPDTSEMRKLWKDLRPKLSVAQELAYKNTVQFSKEVAINSTFSGLGVNTEHMVRAKEKAVALVENVEETIYRISGRDRSTLSLTSAPQKRNYIFGVLGAPLEYARYTKEGELSADKTVIERLSKLRSNQVSNIFKQDIIDLDGDVVVKAEELNNLQFPFCKLLRVHGDLTKNITAFYNGIINNSIEGVYYPDFRIGSATC